jgi:hypothetical protein
MFFKKDYEYGIVRLFWGDKVVGTGFLIQSKYLITCAHVVAACFGEISEKPLEEPPGLDVEIDFPYIKPIQKLNAKVCLWQSKKDIACLEIQSDLPQGLKPVVLRPSSTEEYLDHPFYVFGFPENFSETGISSSGRLQREIAQNEWIVMKAEDNLGYPILPGFSGSPVWDLELQGVVGMTVARDGENEEARIGFMIPYEQLKPVFDAIALFSLLLPEETKLSPHWKNAYQLVETSNIHEATPKTLQEAIIKVLDMTDRNGYRAIAQFVGYFALQALGLDIPKIREWLERQDIINVSELLQNIGQRLPQHTQQKGSPHLLFCVETDHNSDRFNVRAYLIKDSSNLTEQIQIKAPEEILLKSPENKASFTQLEEILQNCLEECVELINDANQSANMRVEIFLPIDKLKLKEVYHWTAIAKSEYEPYPQPVACRYQQVLRLSERLNPQIHTNQMRDSWTKKWDALQKIQCQSPCTSFVSEMDTNGKLRTIKDLIISLRQKESTGLILHRMLSSITEDNPLPILIGTGVPIAIWLDPNCFNRNEVLSVCPQDLPRTVQSKHEAAYNADECGASIGLVWEDPHLIPFVSQSKFKMASN